MTQYLLGDLKLSWDGPRLPPFFYSLNIHLLGTEKKNEQDASGEDRASNRSFAAEGIDSRVSGMASLEELGACNPSDSMDEECITAVTYCVLQG
jgi:hypothetical protein